MSLLPSVNNSSKDLPLFIPNIGSAGAPILPAASISITGDNLGRAYVRALNPAAGASPGTLHLGANPDTYDNVVLSAVGPTPATTLNSTLTVAGGNTSTFTGQVNTSPAVPIVCGGSITTAGNLILSANGGALSGITSAAVPVAGAGAIPNPGNLSTGTWLVVYIATGAGNEAAQPSGIFYWQGSSWAGNAVSFNFTAGAPNCAIGPVAGGATLQIGGAAVPGAGNVYFRKITT